MKIAVAGLGYVGLPLAVLLAQQNTVYAVDVLPEKIKQIEEGKSPIDEAGIAERLGKPGSDLRPTLDGATAYEAADLVIVATPTNYDPERQFFDTSYVDQVVEAVLAIAPHTPIAIKSTVPIGYTHALCDKHPEGRFLFSPEFLREGHALDDNLHPSRIIVGIPSNSQHADELQGHAERLATLLKSISADPDTPTLIVPSTEAECMKLFSNTYLALRVAFFNEVDTYAAMRGLDTRKIIEGVCMDERIGAHYNNPSFGYGGYCLPKDTKQLLADYQDIPQNLIAAVVESNRTRKDWIADTVESRVAEFEIENGRTPLIGIYRLSMKQGSDDFRASSIQGIMRRLEERGLRLLAYEPATEMESLYGAVITHDLAAFKENCDIILANRWNEELADVASKVFTRDLFGRD